MSANSVSTSLISSSPAPYLMVWQRPSSRGPGSSKSMKSTRSWRTFLLVLILRLQDTSMESVSGYLGDWKYVTGKSEVDAHDDSILQQVSPDTQSPIHLPPLSLHLLSEVQNPVLASSLSAVQRTVLASYIPLGL